MKKNVFFVVALIALVAIGTPLFAQEDGMVPVNRNPATGLSIARIAVFNQTFIAVCSGGKIALGSITQEIAGPNAQWRLVQNSTFTSAIQGIATNKTDAGMATGNDTVIAVGNDGRIAWSSDARAWTAVADSKFGTTHVFDAAFGGGRFVAVGWEGKAAYSTDNGRTWTASVLDPDKMQINAVEFGNNRFVAVGQNGTAAWSTDGVRWTKVAPILGGGTARAITFGNGKFVAVGLNGRIAYSTDGAAWTNVADSTFGTSHVFGVAYNQHGKGFVAAGAGGKIAYSADGITWRAHSSSPFANTANIGAVGTAPGTFLVIFGEQTTGNIAGLLVTKDW